MENIVSVIRNINTKQGDIDMILELVFGILGAAIGFTISTAIRDERKEERYRLTVSEIDEQMRKDLEYYKNLSNSLREDVRYYRTKAEKKI